MNPTHSRPLQIGAQREMRKHIVIPNRIIVMKQSPWRHPIVLGMVIFNLAQLFYCSAGALLNFGVERFLP